MSVKCKMQSLVKFKGEPSTAIIDIDRILNFNPKDKNDFKTGVWYEITSKKDGSNIKLAQIGLLGGKYFLAK